MGGCCRRCGMGNHMENKPETPQQQKKYTAAATLIALAVLAGVGYSVHAQQNTPEARHEMELNLGQRYQSRQEYEKAAEYYQKALAQEPADMDALKGLMESYSAQERYDELLSLCSGQRSVLNEEQQEEMIRTAQTLLLKGADRYRATADSDSAIHLYEMVLDISEEGSTAYERAAAQLPELYLSSARETASRSWERVLSVAPDNAEALTVLGDLAYAGGEYETSLKYFLSALENGGEAFTLKRRITEGYLAAAANAPEHTAEEAWKALLEWSPKNIEGYVGLAQFYIDANDMDSAVEILGEGIEKTDSAQLKELFDSIYVTDFEKLVRQIIDEQTTPEMTIEEKRRACYDYVIKRAQYVRTYERPQGDWTKNYAMDVYAKGTGNCYRYAAAFAYLCKELGDDVHVCTGSISAARGGVTPHGWVEIEIDGTAYICDPDMEQAKGGDYYMKTFSQYPVKPLNKETEWEISF